MLLVACAGPVRPAAALRDSVLCLPTDIHSLLVLSEGRCFLVASHPPGGNSAGGRENECGCMCRG